MNKNPLTHFDKNFIGMRKKKNIGKRHESHAEAAAHLSATSATLWTNNLNKNSLVSPIVNNKTSHKNLLTCEDTTTQKDLFSKNYVILYIIFRFPGSVVVNPPNQLTDYNAPYLWSYLYVVQMW